MREIFYKDAIHMVEYALELALPVDRQPEPKDFDSIFYDAERVKKGETKKEFFDRKNKEWREERKSIISKRKQIRGKVKSELYY